MKAFFLICQVFWGSAQPEFTPEEWALLDGCQKPYAKLGLCKVAEASAKKVKHPEVTIITTCSLRNG